MNKLHDLAIDARQLEVRYKSATVLRGLTIQVRRGEVYALLGGNGAGKSTTLNAFLGFAERSGGTVHICGRDPSQNPVEPTDETTDEYAEDEGIDGAAASAEEAAVHTIDE